MIKSVKKLSQSNQNSSSSSRKQFLMKTLIDWSLDTKVLLLSLKTQMFLLKKCLEWFQSHVLSVSNRARYL